VATTNEAKEMILLRDLVVPELRSRSFDPFIAGVYTTSQSKEAWRRELSVS
jgi:hypothetical protein